MPTPIAKKEKRLSRRNIHFLNKIFSKPAGVDDQTKAKISGENLLAYINNAPYKKTERIELILKNGTMENHKTLDETIVFDYIMMTFENAIPANKRKERLMPFMRFPTIGCEKFTKFLSNKDAIFAYTNRKRIYNVEKKFNKIKLLLESITTEIIDKELYSSTSTSLSTAESKSMNCQNLDSTINSNLLLEMILGINPEKQEILIHILITLDGKLLNLLIESEAMSHALIAYMNSSLCSIEIRERISVEIQNRITYLEQQQTMANNFSHMFDQNQAIVNFNLFTFINNFSGEKRNMLIHLLINLDGKLLKLLIENKRANQTVLEYMNSSLCSAETRKHILEAQNRSTYLEQQAFQAPSKLF